MTNSGHSTTIRCCLVFGALILAASCTSTRATNEANREQPQAPIAEKLAKTYGLDSFGQVEAIRYTFNIKIPGRFELARSWVWEPKTGQVTYDGPDKEGKPVKVSYVRSQIESAPANVKDHVDPAFINDQYWLVLPFHAYWDGSLDVQDQGMQKMPLGDGSARRVAMKYTPGDTWMLYLGPDNRVEQMDFQRGGPQKPSEVMVSWAGYKKAGPLLVSTEHQGTADGAPAHIFFSNVAAKLTGSDNWVDAQ